MAIAVTNLAIHPQTGEDGTYYASWDFTPPRAGTLANYYYTWFYFTGDYRANGEKEWFAASSTSTGDKNTTYSPPDSALEITIHVIPVSTTHEVNEQQVSYWQGELRAAAYTIPKEVSSDLPTPEPPDASIDYTGLITFSTPHPTIDPDDTPAEILEKYIDEYWYSVYSKPSLAAGVSNPLKFDSFVKVKCDQTNTSATSSSYSFYGTPGRTYAANVVAVKNPGQRHQKVSYESDMSEEVVARPDGVYIERISAESSTSVFLEWLGGSGATSYTIMYATNPDYFIVSDGYTEVSDVDGDLTYYIITGLETGTRYYFCMRSTNDSGESALSNVVSVILGIDPEPPTTWSNSTTAYLGDSVNLYWVHNTTDGSRMRKAQIQLVKTVGTQQKTETVDFDAHNYDSPPTGDEEEETSYFITINNGELTGDTEIKWKVRTSGVTGNYGDWSVERYVHVYERPSLELSITDKSGASLGLVKGYPFYVSGVASPITQTPIGYSVSVRANESYQTINYRGETVTINAGTEIYSTYVQTSDRLLLELSAQDINLDSGHSYTIVAIVSMDSGIVAQSQHTFKVSWSESTVTPNCELGVDPDTYVAYITPYLVDSSNKAIPGYTLSVYRRQFDGELLEIISGLNSEKRTTITDPHPALDYARYRIIAISNATGAVDYIDTPAYPVNGKEIIIQWDDEWENLDTTNPGSRVTQAYRGSMLKLPYNIDTSEDVAPEAELVNYIGREYPTSYYGTTVSSSATWNTDVPDYDTETLYALRRLQIWHGDCYVREPSGTGYWANVTVSFSITHLERVIPVTLTITRVTGGI